MFLNLYHLMIIHSFLVMGPPSSAYKWVGFFSCMSYEAFGDIFSVSELEHCILRNDMSRPKIGVFAKHLIPHTRFAFTLHRRDIRLLWAINCGSSSLLSLVPIYEPHLLEMQLDTVMRLSMPLQININRAEQTLVLPLFCQWYSGDLEGQYGSGNSKDGQGWLNLLVKYCRYVVTVFFIKFLFCFD
jgi:hypothetical protein